MACKACHKYVYAALGALGLGALRRGVTNDVAKSTATLSDAVVAGTEEVKETQ